MGIGAIRIRTYFLMVFKAKRFNTRSQGAQYEGLTTRYGNGLPGTKVCSHYLIDGTCGALSRKINVYVLCICKINKDTTNNLIGQPIFKPAVYLTERFGVIFQEIGNSLVFGSEP